jgi:hypothetical protein
MGGFIVLEDGRAYAGANWATDATVRAIAAEVSDAVLQAWLLEQQSAVVGMGLTCIDLRELAPQHRPVLHGAIRAAYERVRREGFEQLDDRNESTAAWLQLFGELVEMLRRCEAGESPEEYHPGMRGLIPPSGRRVGPGWEATTA